MQENLKPVNLMLTEALAERLRTEAFKRRISQAAIVRKALQSHFNRLDAANRHQPDGSEHAH